MGGGGEGGDLRCFPYGSTHRVIVGSIPWIQQTPRGEREAVRSGREGWGWVVGGGGGGGLPCFPY